MRAVHHRAGVWLHFEWQLIKGLNETRHLILSCTNDLFLVEVLENIVWMYCCVYQSKMLHQDV